MQESELSEKTEFVVKEFVLLDILIGLFFFFLFFYGLLNSWPDTDEHSKFFYRMLLIALIPALSFTIKGLKNKTAITINKHGIYHYNTFITNWKNLSSAYITQVEITGSIQDNFVLIIEYYREGGDYYIKKIPLTNTQNKSEEDVLATINFFISYLKIKN